MSANLVVPQRLADLAMLAILMGLGAILTAAMVLQYAAGEIPCPLCLLQRVAMFGVCVGIIRHIHHGYDSRNIGMSLIWALYLLMISVRQVLLNIVARPGHAYPGGAILGLHMPVWSVVIAFAVLLAFAVTLALVDGKKLTPTPPSGLVRRIGNVVSLYVIVLCATNLVSAILQCGLGACHTTGYALL